MEFSVHVAAGQVQRRSKMIQGLRNCPMNEADEKLCLSLEIQQEMSEDLIFENAVDKHGQLQHDFRYWIVVGWGQIGCRWI